MKSPINIRAEAFNKKIPHDINLDELVNGVESHDFLRNYSSQYVYQYLVDYVLAFSRNWYNVSNENLKVLDWGCGKGHITYLTSESGAKVTSCDVFDKDDFDSAFGQNTPIINKLGIEVLPLEHEYILPFNDCEYDVILSFGVLEHVPNDLESLKEINRVLKPNGLFFCFFLPYQYSWTQKIAHLRGDNYHDRLYNREIVDKLVDKAGFKLLDCWHRAFLPKNTVKYPNFYLFETIDQFFCEKTIMKYLATNIEFVATKRNEPL